MNAKQTTTLARTIPKFHLIYQSINGVSVARNFGGKPSATTC